MERNQNKSLGSNILLSHLVDTAAPCLSVCSSVTLLTILLGYPEFALDKELRMAYFLISVSGKDRSGIVRDITEALLDLQVNIEDSSMTTLRGQFTMMLIVHVADHETVPMLKASLANLEQQTGLSIRSQSVPEDDARWVPVEPDCVLTVAGGDRMGIVHAVSQTVAEMGCSIMDVSTQARGTEQDPSYFMALELATSGNMETLQQRLHEVAEVLQVDVQLHALDHDTL